MENNGLVILLREAKREKDGKAYSMSYEFLARLITSSWNFFIHVLFPPKKDIISSIRSRKKVLI